MTEKQQTRTPLLIENHTGSMPIVNNAARVGCSVVTARTTLLRYMYHHQWPFKSPETLDELRIALIVERKPILIMDPTLVLTMAGDDPEDPDCQGWVYLKQIKNTMMELRKRRGKRARTGNVR